MTRLGILYHDAIGVERDPESAAAWWRRAAELGDADAQAMLGAAHHLGSGVPVDQPAALVWLLRAAAGGSTFAERFLGPVRATLSPEEIAEAERRARPTFQSASS
jgi:TPR repeat protein